MKIAEKIDEQKRNLLRVSAADSDYFSYIKFLLSLRADGTQNSQEAALIESEIAATYRLLADEIINNDKRPVSEVSFGTSGWRGLLGKDLFVKSVKQVTQAIVDMYGTIGNSDQETRQALEVKDLTEARQRGCVVGFDNRFGGEILAEAVCSVLTANGFLVHYAGEATTGTLSAAVLKLAAAFSINLTPSHNPLEYGGFKFNAADAGPASQVLTRIISSNAKKTIEQDLPLNDRHDPSLQRKVDALDLWKQLVRENRNRHGLDYDSIIASFRDDSDVFVAVDCVHGASRVHIRRLFDNLESERLVLLRSDPDVTFGGIAPEPSSKNLKQVKEVLAARKEPFKLGMIIDPDADRIRFVDGEQEISMNQFGAMAFHYLHEIKKKSGLLAKTVATSNFANAIAKKLGEKIFEPPVGFKEFKPVIGKALVCFEESDGISVIGHTPEKDAYIGLLLALDMILSLRKNISEYFIELENEFGHYYPDRDSVAVSVHGKELKDMLGSLRRFTAGSSITIGNKVMQVKELITLDGYKIILEDDSWLMIRPSGTEPKVR
ncbi:MAG: phosphoglucomutase, partial [Deltaproteobacteria bacterium]